MKTCHLGADGGTLLVLPVATSDGPDYTEAKGRDKERSDRKEGHPRQDHEQPGPDEDGDEEDGHCRTFRRLDVAGHDVVDTSS
ncbi:hypothetical protein, partial [Rhodococcus ruber]|uniref:hypothetical protein n=1 Tax=Rhodococcus ruber TaxID=1830 RepID=UPI001C11ADE3